jgi:hypothetical protein
VPRSIETILSPNVEKIFRSIQDLPQGERHGLFVLLTRTYEIQWSDDRAKFARPWHEPRNLFGTKQKDLLDFLDGKGAVRVDDVIEDLWEVISALRARLNSHARTITISGVKLTLEASHYDACLQTLRARLRQLKKSTNDRLLKLRYKWKIVRPRNGYLELRIL